MRLHGLCEARLDGSGIPWTILRPTMFMQNLVPMYGASVATTATFSPPARIPMRGHPGRGPVAAATGATTRATND